MLASIALEEGGYWTLVETTAIDVLESTKTGKLDTSVGVLKPAAIRLGDNIIWDYVLGGLGRQPLRYVNNPCSFRTLGAADVL